MEFIDWFNPYDKEHMKAYKYLNEKGYWPKNFIPENVEMSCHWQHMLFAKMADCWMKYMTYFIEETY